MTTTIPPGSVSLHVTSVDTEGPFFVVYGQSEKNAIEQVNPLIKGYIGHFERGVGAVTDPKQISVGLVCIGKNADSNYYRVKILSIDQRNHQVETLFIDYGNRVVLKFSDLRIFSPSKTSFLQVKPLCTKYILSSGVLVAGKEDEAINWIQPYIVGEETYAKVVDPRIPAIDLHFLSNGVFYNATGSLLHKVFFTHIAVQDQYFMYQNIVEHKIPVQQFVQPPPLAPSGGVTPPIFREPPRKPHGTSQTALSSAAAQPFIPGGVAVPSVTRDLKPQSDALLHGHIYQVVVSYVDEDDMTVSVHKKEDFDSDLRALMGTINASEPTPYPSILEPGAYVLARVTPRDMLLRAVVFQVSGADDRAQVYFVDFGHRAHVSLNEIYALPPEVAAVKNMAHRCHLANLEQAGPWSREVRNELEEITKEKVLNMKILTSTLKTKRTVSLSFADDNRSVVDVLTQQLKPLMFESVHIPKGQSVEVVISHALSASRFFVQLTANQAALDALMDQVDAHCAREAPPPPHAPPPFTETELVSGNLPCCAKFAEDGRWYRAIITDYEPTRPGVVTVRYVDFGNESAVNVSDVRPIPRALMKVRTQAVECALAGHSSRRQTDAEEAQFQALIGAAEYTFLMSIKMHLVGSVLLVELWDLETKNSVRHTLEAMVQAAQKAKPPTPVKSSPDTPASNISAASSNPAGDTKNSFARKASAPPRGDKYLSSDESDGAAALRPPARKPRGGNSFGDRQSGGEEGGGARPGGAKPGAGGGADSTDWRKKREEDSSGGEQQRKPRFGGDHRGDSSHRGAGGDDSRHGGGGGGWGGEATRSGGGGGDRGGGGNRFGGGDGDSRPPPRKPRYGDENDRMGGGGSYGNSSGDDRSYGGENKFRSGGGDKGGWKSGGGGREERGGGDKGGWKTGGGGREERGGGGGGGGGFKKREDFTSDNWGAAKSFDSNSRSFPAAKPERPKLLDGYPAGGRVPTLPALGALEPPRPVAVTHYESPLSFFLQLQDSHHSFLEFMKGLQSDYIKRKPAPISDIAVGQHVMAQFKEDRVLYRAEVLTTTPVALPDGRMNREIKVKFFDYGNESTVPANKVWHLASEHCALPMQSIPCRLSNIESAVTEEAAVASWSMDCLQYFAEDNYQMTIRGYDDQSKAEVDLASVDSGLQVSTRLVEAGLCRLVSSQVSVSVEAPVDLPLLLHQTLAVHISHLHSSTRFFIHLEPDTPELIAAKIAELLATPEELFPLTAEEIAPGKFVLATPDTESWYRARVTGTPQGDTCTYGVTFIDYGDSADVPLENIRDIPEAACDWCPQATECYLASATAAESTPLDEALEGELAESLADVNASVYVASVDAAHRLGVVLYSEAGALEARFHPRGLPPLAPASLPPLLPYPVLRQGERVFISSAAPAGLSLQRASNEAAQESFAAELQGYYAAATALLPLESPPPPGAVVAAHSLEFDSWYRARVESVEEESGQVRVLYVDYGNCETLPLGSLRALDPAHCYPPAFSLQTTLPATFVKDSYEIFAAVDAPHVAVYARRGDGWVVDLVGPDGCSLLEKHQLTGQLKVTEPLQEEFVQELSVVDRWVAQGPCPVTVMSFESPAELSISLQADESRQAELQTRLQGEAARTLPILGACPELCLGKFSEDGEWYRAQVLDAEFRALFVDYGNKDIVPEIRKLSYTLRRIPPLSVKCTLPVVPVEADWSQAAIDRLDNLVTDQTPRARILDYDTVPAVELILEDGTSVADVLVEEKLAARKSYKVVISHVNGPEAFYVQYAENAALDDVFKVMETIDANAPVEVSQINVGDILAAKFPEDEAWYRARVLSKSPVEGETADQTDVTIKVLFIDFGNTSETSEFRRLPSSVSRLPPLAKPCTLALPEGVEAWPDFAREKLEQVSNDEFTLKWLDVGKNIVELTTAQNSNVAAIVLEPPPLKNYMLSHINSANDFYLQEEEHPHIGTITDLVASLDTEAPLSSVSPGDLVAAKFIEDGAWYRARVITSDPPQVLFIDYGNTSPASEFRALSDALSKFEPAAIHCSLALPEDATFAEYSRAASAKFVELSQGGETLVTCEFLEAVPGGPRPVELYIGEASVTALLANVPDVPASAEVPPDVDATHKFTVCWVNSADDFYLQQVDDPSLDIIMDLLEPIAEAAPIAVKPGDLVASQFVDDEMWYRSRVLREGADATSYEVHFVDYGNSATASAFRALPEGASLEAIPARARHFRLVEVASEEEEMTGVLTDMMDSGRAVEVVEEEGRVVLVEADGRRLPAVLAEEEAQATTRVEGETTYEQARKVTSSSETTSEIPTVVSPLRSTTSESKDASPLQPGSPVKEASPISPPTSPLKASSPTRTASSLKEMARASEAQKVHVITHVNSPSDFYLMVDAEAAIQIGKLLNTAGDFEPVHSIIGGATYAAFNEREDSWHRAQLLEMLGEDEQGKNLYLVKYKDLGNTDIVTKEELRELPEAIRDLPEVVKNCELDTPESFILWSEPAVRKMTDLVVMGQFHVETLGEGEPARVRLRSTDGLDVNQMLLRIHEETKEAPGTPAEEANETLNDTILSEAPSKTLILQRVTLSHYTSPGDFYVQVAKDRNILDSINSLLPGLKPVAPAQVLLDELYAGRQSGGDLWFRVMALNPSGETGYAVRRIDYGGEDTCTKFGRLSEDLSHISPLAHHCRVEDASLAATLAAWHEKKTELVIVDMEEPASGQPATVVLSEADSGEATDSEATQVDHKAPNVNGGATNGFSNGDAESPTKSERSPVKELGKASTPNVSPVKESSVTPTKDSAIVSPTKNSAVRSPAEENEEAKVNTSLDDTFVSCVSEKTILEDTITEDQAEVYILNTNAIDDFYVHLETDTPALEEMTEALREVNDLTHPLVSADQVRLNEVYVTLYEEDSLYYRARALAKVNDRFRVLFVDYGNQSEVSELRQCPPELSADKTPPIAKHCEFLKPTPEGASVDLNPTGPLGKQFEAFDSSALDLKVKSLSPLGADKFAIEIVIADSGENLLTYLSAISEDVDK